MNLIAICYTCRQQHPIRFAQNAGNAFLDWYVKHPPEGHASDFVAALAGETVPAISDFTPNADVKIEYAASAALTITLASLATSATLVAGRESTAVSNATNKYLDQLLAGKITTGTSPVAGSIEVWLYGSHNDTPDYPDTIVGTDNARTLTSVNIKWAGLRHVVTMATDTTNNRAYSFGPDSVAARFGGILPKNWGVFVTHSSGVNLNATGGNHAINHTPVYQTSV